MDLPEFMKQLALDAGALTLQYLENGCTDTESKATEKDVVTIADKAAEAFIVNRLREAYPDYDVYGEESGRSGSGGSPYLFWYTGDLLLPPTAVHPSPHPHTWNGICKYEKACRFFPAVPAYRWQGRGIPARSAAL